MLLQGRLHGPESLSRELFASGLRLAANRDLVDAGREELGKRREELVTELERVVADVGRIDEIASASLRVGP
jgi:glycerol-3-phosphate O-acyltransferase